MPPLDISGDNHIPEAVRRSTARAEEMARQAGIANVPASDEPPAGETPPAPPEDNTPPAGETPAAASPAPAPQPNEWEQKYRTLQGKYDSEIPGLRAQVNGLQQLLANLETRSPPQPVQPAPARAAPTVVALPPEDVEAYGQELIDAARRWALMEVQPLVDELRAEIKNLGSNFSQVETSQREIAITQAREFVRLGLDSDPKLGPIWRATNADPGYIAWVQQPDPFSGQIRQPLLQGAFDSGQVDRVKAFFNAYLSEHTATQVPPQDSVHTPPAQGADRPSLEDFAAPGRGGPSTPPASGASDKRMWTSPEIAAFYRDVNRGMYAGREADKLRTEQDIIAAATEGRIR